MSRRAFVVVLDACGVGELPDAADYGDAGANTLGHLAREAGGLDLPVLGGLGLGNIIEILGVTPVADPAVHGRLHPLGPGKESTTGHWELMGVVPEHPLPTYPDGFGPEVVARLRDATGLEFCCNKPYSGTEVLDAYGPHHLETGEAILYTSADSVLQIATHVDVLDEPGLYAACEAARAVMTGTDAVGRVIARPFDGGPGTWHRREGRRDYAVKPPGRSYLEELQADGVPVHAVGKIRDLFAGVGIDVKHAAATNDAGITATTELLRSMDRGLAFTNLVETDQLYGHRHDIDGFHGALREIDAAVGQWLATAARRRPARADRRPRRRPDDGPHRPHARVRAAAGDVHRSGRGAARRAAGRRRRERAAVAEQPRGGRAAGDGVRAVK